MGVGRLFLDDRTGEVVSTINVEAGRDVGLSSHQEKPLMS